MPFTATAASPERPSCSVLVMSCDAYSDLWRPFFTLFWRYWPDCPWPVYLGTNHRSVADECVFSLCAGDAEWTQRLRFCLDHIDSDFVLLLLDDYFFDGPVDTAIVSENLAALARLGGYQLRLFPLPGPDRKLTRYRGIGIIHPRAAYRVSTQAAFWKRTHLLDILAGSESIWDFEWNATKRSRVHETGYYATYEPVIRYRQVVERGEWFRAAAVYFGKQQIGCDFRARPIISRGRAFKRSVTARLRHLKSRLGALALRFGG